MEGIPLKLTVIEVNVQEVRDVMFYGAKLAIEPTYEKRMIFVQLKSSITRC